MKAVLLVPRRADGGHRDKLWAWCRARWEAILPDVPIVEGHHEEGLFSRALAINRAARLAGDWDLGIVIDSDVFLRASAVRAALDTAQRTGRVTWPHRRWRGLSAAWTKRLILADGHDFGPEIDRDDMDVLVERTTPISWSCCFVVPRAVWDDVGGFDQRFEGWGFEDMAWQSTIVGLYGHERLEGDVYHAWHERSDERIEQGKSGVTASREYAINARLGRRYMVALRRDHGLHDRPGLPASEEERLQDIDNLVRDDAKLAIQSRRYALPDWADWWPTLEELRAGAREYNAAHRTGAVTVVVHSGGLPEHWPARRSYLQQALPSITANLAGPIVQRVVYDCWGDAGIRAELTAIARPHGFYVAGPDYRPDYTEARGELWRYLRKRATASLIFGTEDDFVLTRPVDLVAMAEALEANTHLSQIVLTRDAYDSERERGGILGWPLESFASGGGNGTRWLEHRNFWSANPSLFRRSLTRTAWPSGRHSETLFGQRVFRDPAARSALWGTGEEWVRHIGAVRAGIGY